MNKSNNSYPLISIIMNCYNGEDFLHESIESILSQTYKNWELIFWDNQSKDKSSEIFKSYKDLDDTQTVTSNVEFSDDLLEHLD